MGSVNDREKTIATGISYISSHFRNILFLSVHSVKFLKFYGASSRKILRLRKLNVIKMET